MGNFFIDKETLAREEQEAKERGISVLQLRYYKKLSEKRKLQIEKNKEKRKKEKEKKIEREKLKKQKQREREILKKQLKKEKDKEKERLKKEKEKEEKKQWLIEHPKETIKKRPVGRPKKRGPKKKYKRKKPKPPRTYNAWDYKIILCKNGRQVDFIGKYLTLETAYNKLKELEILNKEVIFPSKTCYTSQGNNISDTRYEYLLLERKNESTEDKVYLLRNEFGKLVEQKSNSKHWNIIDKMPCLMEETFWVWGFNNKTERKTFQWIYDNILLNTISTYDVKRVLLYKNKVIIKNDDETMDIIFCKTKYDAFKFYELMENKIKEDKIKQVFFIGSYDKINDKRRKLEEQLIEMTGWNKKKIQMSTTSEYLRKKC